MALLHLTTSQTVINSFTKIKCHTVIISKSSMDNLKYTTQAQIDVNLNILINTHTT